MALESGCAVSAGLGKRDPQLQRVQLDRLLADRILGVRDALAAGHEVQHATTDDDIAADRVAMADVAREGPGHRLQSDVRVRLDPHPGDLRTESVEEAPRAHQREVALRKGAMHRHRAHPAERHLARLEQQRPRSGAVRGFRFLRLMKGDHPFVGIQPCHLSNPGAFGQSMVRPGTSWPRR